MLSVQVNISSSLIRNHFIATENMEIIAFSCRRFMLLHLGVLIFIGMAACNKNCSTAVNSQVCSSNGVTYSNLCEFENAKSEDSDLVIIYQSACPEACLRNCSKEPVSKVCSLNVQTFNNRCEFEKQKCLQKANWIIIYENECTTLAPPIPTGEGKCEKHQTKVDFIPQYGEICNPPELKEKAAVGTLTFDDIKDCYYPRCHVDMHYYHLFQCDLIHHYCWCANPDGSIIPDTFSKDMTYNDCIVIVNSMVKTCTHNDVTYNEKENVPLPSNTCGKCTCVDGSVTCSLRYNTTSPLNETQIDDLKNDILQMFYYQTAEGNNDIVHADIHPHPFTRTEKIRILEQKFYHYDRDDSYTISPFERDGLDIDFYKFSHCDNFGSQVQTLMDLNSDGAINLREWGKFFGISNLSRRKRSLSDRLDRHANRRKFKYILV